MGLQYSGACAIIQKHSGGLCLATTYTVPKALVLTVIHKAISVHVVQYQCNTLVHIVHNIKISLFADPNFQMFESCK